MSFYGNRDGLRAEVNATLDMFMDCGFVPPHDLDDGALIAGVGHAFFPTEINPTNTLRKLSPASNDYFLRTVQPTIRESAEKDDPKTLALAWQVGRAIGANGISGPVASMNPPMTFAERGVIVDDQKIRFHPKAKPGVVLEFGIGLNGYFSHAGNVKAGKYAVHAILKDKFEVTALGGIGEYLGVPAESMSMVDGGIKKGVAQLLGAGAAHMTDVVVASRVHMAGKDLLDGIEEVDELLRPGGLLIARGPQRYDEGASYNQVYASVNRNPNMQIVLDMGHVLERPDGSQEANRLTIAHRK